MTIHHLPGRQGRKTRREGARTDQESMGEKDVAPGYHPPLPRPEPSAIPVVDKGVPETHWVSEHV